MSRPELELARFRYPDDWPDVADQVRARAGGRCECRGECANPWCSSGQDQDGRCKMQEQRHCPRHTVVALDRNPSNAGSLGDRPNLRAFCPACADAFRYGFHQRDPAEPPARRGAGQGSLEL